MLKITTQQVGPQLVTMKLEGRIVGQWVPLLERECLYHRTKQQRVTLDCQAVTYVDEGGLEALQRIISRGVEISGCSALIAALLKGR